MTPATKTAPKAIIGYIDYLLDIVEEAHLLPSA
jgi:hypothetical protein